jgi:hypothetical protein
MAERRSQDTQVAQAQFDQYAAGARAQAGPRAIQTAKQLLDNGTISQEEFDAIKAKALA